MVKKNILLLVVFVVSSSCFGMNKPPKKNNQFSLSDKTMKIILQILNSNKQPKRITGPESISNPTPVSFNPNPVGKHIPKEFECKTKDELTEEFIKNEFVMVPTEAQQNAERAEMNADKDQPSGSMRSTPQTYWQRIVFKKPN